MGKNGLYLSGGLEMMKKLCPFILIIFFTACFFPKVVFLEDTLSAEEHNDLGVIYLKQKKYGLAEKEFLKAIKKEPQWDVPYYNLGNNYYFEGDLKRSEEYFRKAIKLNDKNTDAMNNLAHLLSEQCRKEEALEWIKKAISIHIKDAYLDTLKNIESNECKK